MEGCRLHPADASFERDFPTPLLDFHGIARLDRHRIAGEDLRLDFNVGGIADFENLHAGRNDGFAFLHHSEHHSGNGRLHFHQISLRADIRALEHRTGLGKLEIIDLEGEFHRAKLCGADGGFRLDAVAVGFRDGAILFDRADPFALRHGELERGGGGFERGLRALAGGLVQGHHRLGLGPRPGIEQRGDDGLDEGDAGFPRFHGIARLERDAAHFSGGRRRHDVAVTDPGFAFLGNAHRQGSAGDHAGFHHDRLGPQTPADESKQEESQNPRHRTPEQVFSGRIPAGCPGRFAAIFGGFSGHLGSGRRGLWTTRPILASGQPENAETHSATPAGLLLEMSDIRFPGERVLPIRRECGCRLHPHSL